VAVRNLVKVRPVIAAAGVVVAIVAVFVLLRGTGGPSAAAVNQHYDVGTTRLSLTKHYLVVNNVVPPEHMYQPAQANTLHPTEGEYILHGVFAPITPTARHFEAHVYSRATGDPVHGAHVEITVKDDTTGSVYRMPDVTSMQDVVVGPRDFHYGNNVNMPAGHAYTVIVTVNGEKGVIHYRLM
jgi:hypothetical protein